LNQEKGQRPVEGVSWDGWELVGSRWIKRNPISDEELESAAAFYSNTNRRHPNTAKKMKRHSSAEMSSFVTADIFTPATGIRARGRSRSINMQFWDEPTSLRQLSSDGGSVGDPSIDAQQSSEPLLESNDESAAEPAPSPLSENKIQYDLL
jgi:hypothetical protein